MMIELHTIQSFAPSCLNRDDTNAPKDCVFGGARRARISSQCIKRSIRQHAMESGILPGENIGIRTKRLIGKIEEGFVRQGKAREAAQKVARHLVEGLGFKTAKDSDRTQYLIYLGQDEITSLVDAGLAHWDVLEAYAPAEEPDEKESKKTKKKKAAPMPKEIQDALKPMLQGRRAVDVALFGRMLADKPEKNIDAACQVAHALSTHKVDMDMDFYTAVDDLIPEDTSGADMMGVVEFNSASFYRYAVIYWEKLLENLGNDEDLARAGVRAFLRGGIEAIPTGKQNTFAAQNPPSFCLIVIRRQGMPWSLANAFEKPVRAGDKGFVEASIERLDDYFGKLTALYASDDEIVYLAHTQLNDTVLEQVGARKAAITTFIDEAIDVLPGESA